MNVYLMNLTIILLDSTTLGNVVMSGFRNISEMKQITQKLSEILQPAIRHAFFKL